LLRPLHHALQVLAQNWVALGMSDDGGDALIAELHETVCGLRRNAVVVQLDQHVVRACDGVARGIGEHVLQIVVGEMEVAAEAERERGADERLQMIDQALEINTVVVVAVVGVRGRDLMRDAVGRGHAAHGYRNVPGLGAVVHFRKNVRMNVDHDLCEHRRASGVVLKLI